MTKLAIVETDFYGDPLAERPTYTVESYAKVAEELKPLHYELWKERAGDIPLDMDYAGYDELEKIGALHLVTARDRDELIGYHLSVIHAHLHYRTVLTCYTDLFYLRPQYRTGMTGYKMLKYWVNSLKARRVKLIYTGHSLEAKLEPIFRRLGFEPFERSYKRMLHA